MRPVNITTMADVAERLIPLQIPFAFLGGAVVPLLLDNPSLVDVRPTKDIDVIIEVMAKSKMHILDEQLRSIGFLHDISEGAPQCRWILNGVLVDVMPVSEEASGWTSTWFREALITSYPMELSNNVRANIITAPYFLATKLEAFLDRGQRDYYGSPDIEDMMLVIDGRSELISEIEEGNPGLQRYISKHFHQLLIDRSFVESLHGHVPSDPASQMRAPLLLEKIRKISQLHQP